MANVVVNKMFFIQKYFWNISVVNLADLRSTYFRNERKYRSTLLH